MFFCIITQEGQKRNHFLFSENPPKIFPEERYFDSICTPFMLPCRQADRAQTDDRNRGIVFRSYAASVQNFRRQLPRRRIRR